MLKKCFIAMGLASLFFFPAPGVTAEGAAGELFLVHARTSLKLDDAQLCAVPNVAWAALKKGYRVVILFDASGVTAIHKGGMFGGDKTPLDKAALPEREREALSAQLGVPIEAVPHNYGEYIRFLKAKGVALYANRTMMLLYKIGEGDIDAAVTSVGLEEMINLLAGADVYAAY